MHLLSKKHTTSVLTALLLLCSIYIFISNIALPNIFNSDALFLAHLNKGVFQHHQNFKYWNFSPTHYLFPDGTILFLLSPIFSNFKLAILLTDIVMLGCYYLLMVGLGTQLAGKENKNIFRLFALISIILGKGSLGDIGVFNPLFNSHIGVNVIGTLLGLLLIIKLLNKPKVIYYFLLGVVAFLNTFSDLLYIVTMVGMSLIGSIGIFRVLERRKQILLVKINLVLLISGGLGYLSNSYDFFHLHIYHYPIKNLLSFHGVKNLYKTFQLYYTANPIIVLIVFFYFIFSVTCFIKTVFLFEDKAKLDNKTEINSLFFIITTGLSIAVLMIFALIFDYDLYSSGFSLGHYSAAILIPVFLGVPLLIVKYSQIGAIVEKYYFYFSSIILVTLLLTPYKSLEPIINYYPIFTECLDNYVENGKIIGLNGAARYWDARLNSMLSKNNLNIVAINPDITPMNWMNTRQDYLNKKFNFIIMKSGESIELIQTILKKNGKPQAILACPGDNTYLIYVYKKSFSLGNL